jgi:hypothetical protein
MHYRWVHWPSHAAPAHWAPHGQYVDMTPVDNSIPPPSCYLLWIHHLVCHVYHASGRAEDSVLKCFDEGEDGGEHLAEDGSDYGILEAVNGILLSFATCRDTYFQPYLPGMVV